MVVGVLLVVNADRVSFVAVVSEGCTVLLVVSVVSAAVTLKGLPPGLAIKGIGC